MQVGDRVERINADWMSIKVGEKGTVTAYYPEDDGDSATVKWDNGETMRGMVVANLKVVSDTYTVTVRTRMVKEYVVNGIPFEDVTDAMNYMKEILG